MNFFRTALAVTVVTLVLIVNHAGAAAQAWVESYNYKKLNNTYLVSAPVTKDAGDRSYVINERANNVKVSAPSTNTGSETREFFWPANASDVRDGQTCATWSKQSDAAGQPVVDIIQQGAALRIVQTPTSTRGISVTKNIWLGGTWIFNVHVWDSSAPGGVVATQLAGFDMSDVVGKLWWEGDVLHSTLKPFSWHLCARTSGNMLQFKVWTNEQANQPSWTDSRYVREVPIPAAWDVPGKTGWYVGHLKPGYSAEFQALQTSYRP